MTAGTRDAKESGLFSWPDGRVLEKFVVPIANLAAATKGDAILIRPLREYAVAVMRLTDKQIFQVSSSPALER